MAVTLYSFNKLCDVGRLSKEIKESAIVTAEDHIETISSPAETKVYMKDALSSGDQTILSNLVTAHVNTPLPDPNLFTIQRPAVVYGFHDLVRATGSRNMNVNGSTFPVQFDFTPGVNETWEVEKLLFGMDDVGLTDFGLFGGITALANGILITVRSGGQVYVIGNIKDNVDVAMMFPGNVVAASGVLDAADGIYGAITFGEQIKLKNATGDYIRMTVRDNLTSINTLRGMAVARKVIG